MCGVLLKPMKRKTKIDLLSGPRLPVALTANPASNDTIEGAARSSRPKRPGFADPMIFRQGTAGFFRPHNGESRTGQI